MDDSLPMCRIAVYLYKIGNQNVGLGEFSYQLAANIAKRAAELKNKCGIEFLFIVPKKFVSHFGNDVKYFSYSNTPWKNFVLRNFVKADIFHNTYQCSHLERMRKAKLNLTTIHDINFIYEKSGHSLERYKRKFAKSLEHSDVIAYISDFVKHDVEAHFSPRCDGKVIYNGVADLNSVHGDFAKFNLPDNGYLFHISSLMPKKNVHKIVEMMRYMPEERLVVVGNLNSYYAHRIQKLVAEWKLTNVTLLSHVSNEEKAELYRHCKAFLFPSLCEGFGLPPVEAMHFGKPVFLSKLTSLPEIGGDCAYYYDNLDPEVMAEVTREGLADFTSNANADKLRCRAASFSWDKCVDDYVKLYIELQKGINNGNNE